MSKESVGPPLAASHDGLNTEATEGPLMQVRRLPCCMINPFVVPSLLCLHASTSQTLGDTIIRINIVTFKYDLSVCTIMQVWTNHIAGLTL